MENMYNRTNILLGKENVDVLKSKHIMVCGIGGVGSYVVESLARVGIGNITIIDKDIVDITNINRQIIALNSTIGKDKVDVAKQRLLDINSEITVDSIKLNITKENILNLLKNKKVDYVVDCVDNVEAKIAIIENCYNEGIKCISCMGTANKVNPLDLRVSDIYKTNTCPLAKIIRKKLKQIGIKKQKVVFSIEEPKKISEEEKNKYGNTLGSSSFVPSCAGLILTSEVIKDILNISK